MINGKNVEGELKVQDTFTSYLANISKTTASSVTPSSSLPDFRSYLGLPCPRSMVLEPVSEAEIARIVNGLRGSSSSGPDHIPTKVVKFILPVIVCAFTRLVNLSFENGVFSSALKRARAIILSKGGSRNNPANYHFISLLSVLSKISEKAMLSLLLDFLNS